MTPKNPTEQLLARFKLPPRDGAALSFCGGQRPTAVRAWAEALPATRINYTSVVLYKALPEITRLKTTPEHRLEMLEAVRPYVQQCIQGLAKYFLNQPLILPEAPLKSAVIAQALQKHLTNGYSIAVYELLQQSGGRKGQLPREQLSLACHRAITGLGLMLLRSYQLYSQTPEHLWLELHSLYRVAEHLDLLGQVQQDPLLVNKAGSTIAHAYTRVLLLACARPNQIRQTEVSATYEALEVWARLTRLRPAGKQHPDNLFLVNLSADIAPVYKSRHSGESGSLIRELDLSRLLAAFRQGEADAAFNVPQAMSAALLQHLEQSWGANHQRSFERRPTTAPITVCVGLSSLHHYTCGGSSFAEFIGIGDEDEIEVSSFASEPFASEPRAASRDHSARFPQFSVDLVDSSPAGYCLEWREHIPIQVKAGEVLGLRERGRHRWSLGVIRWIRQEHGATRLGVQLLGSKTKPYGAAIQQAGGETSDYHRVLMLPELKTANQPATLLTAFAPFQENHRLLLTRNGKTQVVQLTCRLFSTGSISQFSFRSVDAQDLTTSEDADADENENASSVWTKHPW